MRNCFKPSPSLFFLFSFLLFFFLLGDVFFLSPASICTADSCAMSGWNPGPFSANIILGAGFWLGQDFAHWLIVLGDDVFQHLAQSVLLVVYWSMLS